MEWLKEMLGLDADSLALWQMAFRALIVYIAAIALVRVGEKRFIGKFTAFDVILGIMLGSILSRAITNAEGFFGHLTAALVLVTMHYIFAVFSFHSDRFGDLVKGTNRVLVRDGEIDWDTMRKGHISRTDLETALREEGRVESVNRVHLACLERSGNISVIRRKSARSDDD